MDITVNQSDSTQKSPMIKGAILSIILIAVLFLVIFIVGWFSKEAFPILIFVTLMAIPLLVIFRNDIPTYMPSFMRRFVVDTNPRTTTAKKKPKVIHDKGTSTKQIQIYYIVGMTIITIMICVLLYLVRKSLRPEATAQETINERALLKLLGSLFLTCFLGVLVLKFEKYNNK